MIIYIETPFNIDQRNTLKTALTGDTAIFKADLTGEAAELDAISNADIIFGNPRPVEWLQQATSLKWLQLYSTGFEYYRKLQLPALVTNMQDYYSEPCAETAIAGIMALYRGMDKFPVLKSEKKWVGYTMRAELHLLANKKVLILGAGNIAKRTARILGGFDCQVTSFARTKEKGVVNTVAEVEALIPAVDIIISCLPGTEETKGFLTPVMIQHMKSTAIFCNVGRGNLVADENVLVQALMDNKIGGAVLDVTDKEPLPEDHPFWNCPNTILSQHSGGGDASEYDGILNFFLQNLDRYKSGQKLQNLVELGRGY
ncbi:MAG: D-2-hydroxyacid dehydrogenase [Chitinophagaceae bacterium]